MEAATKYQPLNATQIHFLQTLQFVKNDTMMQELQQVVSDFYFKKMQEEADLWWKKNDMSSEKLDEMCSNLHFRTPYK